ncbi:complex I subunit 1 family protein [Arthrobacter cryoconiti]|uniref:Complex I subunit 1 family protein n=1 Tax=Arthrobacter cryoconiti TaxID=748907 RepID=A0ABV8R405_9MICC|nr:complex I subunit 1 family protein [Arthrobacter cryoconiti]MCC9069391.1 NADH-quinone oxidoreductase subunit H [Arthrobacter cryoconiti]
MDSTVTGALWALILPFGLAVAALLAAAGNAVLDSRARGLSATAGMVAPVRETARLLRQQRRTLPGADSLLWRIGGAGLAVAAVLKVLVIPFGNFTFADLPTGLVWFNAMDVLLWALWWLLGWGANSGWSLVGGYRFLAQALSYELPLMFALTAPAVGAGSLRLLDIQDAQDGLWFVVWMPAAFLVYAASVVAFSSWGPFQTATGRDAAGGVIAELSGVDRLLVLAGRYMVLVAGAAFAVPLFFGGGSGPWLPGSVWVIVKSLALVAVFITARRLFPTLRPERLAEIALVLVMPLVLIQVAVAAVIVVVNGGAL